MKHTKKQLRQNLEKEEFRQDVNSIVKLTVVMYHG